MLVVARVGGGQPVQMLLGNFVREALCLCLVDYGVLGDLGAVVELDRVALGHGGPVALDLRVAVLPGFGGAGLAILDLVSATPLEPGIAPTDGVGFGAGRRRGRGGQRAADSLVKVVAPDLFLADLLVIGVALLIVDWVALQDMFHCLHWHLVSPAPGALDLLGLDHGGHCHLVAHLLVVLIRALLHI